MGYPAKDLRNFIKDNKSDISILEKQIETELGWLQLVANKFRNQIVIQDTEVETIHKKLKSNVGKEELFIEQIFLSFENKKENDVLKLDIDPKSHAAWTGGKQKLLDKGRVSKFNKKFQNFKSSSK